jgi:hypothetical protein
MRLAGVVLAVALGAAAAGPPPFPFKNGLAAATLKQRPATLLNLGAYAIHFEQTPMREVVRTVGAGALHHQGDAGDSLDWICYRIPGPAPQLLWITSGELQGGQVVDSVVARFDAAAPADCAELPERFRGVTLDHALWLGSTQAAVQAALGPASASREGWLEWCFEVKGRDEHHDEASNTTSSVDYDESSSLVLRLDGGQVAELFAAKDTTY